MAGRGRHDGVGRKKGTPNKKTLDCASKARELGVDPFEILLRFAKGDWQGLGYSAATVTKIGKGGECYEVDTITSDHRLKAASEAAQYLYPKRKAIEVTEVKDPNEDRPLKDVSDEELDAM